ncbi:MAG: hypothetical protein K0S51_1218 [Bacillales bacterium]|nr:hypothetical protein [Bacillales bacterium]
MFTTSCSNQLEEQKIEVQKRIGNDNNFEDFKEVTNKSDVKKVRNILESVDWENAKVQMFRPEDYKFLFEPNTKKLIFVEALPYRLWISPDKDQVELINFFENKYAQLGKNKSAELFKILTGSKLTD